MNTTYNSKLTSISRTLRKNMTKEERHLWYDFLKTLSINVCRQKVINNFIVDFYIPIVKIVIELDGAQHYDDDAIIKDKERDLSLNSLGIKVLRYTNLDIANNFDGVCEDILRNINLRIK